jgi:hypothetical protein
MLWQLTDDFYGWLNDVGHAAGKAANDPLTAVAF